MSAFGVVNKVWNDEHLPRDEGVTVAAMANETPAIDAIQEYMEFAEYGDGSISTAQLASGVKFQRDADKGRKLA